MTPLMENGLPVDPIKAVKELQARIEQLEQENANLRWQLAEGFRDSVRDFSDSLLDTLDPVDVPPATQQR